MNNQENKNAILPLNQFKQLNGFTLIIVVILSLLLSVWLIKIAWKHSVASIFNMREITMTEAFSLMALVYFLGLNRMN